MTGNHQARAASLGNALERVAQDVRYAVRKLCRARAFTFAAVGTLALGIGAATAIFRAMNAALLRPLPYPDWQDLHTVRTAFTDGRVTSGLVAPVELDRLNDPQLPIVRAAASTGVDDALLLDDRPVPSVVYGVSVGFFELFGLPYVLGPGFSAEHHEFGGPAAVVISHRLWQEVLGGDPNIVGERLLFAGGERTVVGVAAPEMDVPRGTDAWFNLQLWPQSLAHNYEGYLRLQPGTSPERLRSVLAAVADGLARDYPGAETNRAFVLEPLVNAMVGNLRPILVIVMAATGLLLVLACVNVTNLLLARAAGRAREMAVRSALGASRARLVRQLLTESVVLAVAGGLAGVPLAYLGVRALLSYGAASLPRLEAVPFDFSVLLFTVGVLMTSAVVVGLAPAIQQAAPGRERMLGESGRSVRGSRSTRRVLRYMIVAEVALAVMLVAGAGWLLASFSNLRNQDPGFAAEGRLALELSLPAARYGDAAERNGLSQRLLERMRGIPGVVEAASTSCFPTHSFPFGMPVLVEGSTDVLVSRMCIVSPGYFSAMGVPLRQGRTFTAGDREGTAPVTVVDERFAQRLLSGRDPTIAQIRFGFTSDQLAIPRPIVGVVGDVKYDSLWSAPEPTLYLLSGHADLYARETLSVVVSTRLADPAALIPAIRAEVAALDPLLAFRVDPVAALVAATLTPQRLGMTLMLAFGALALTLAAVGIYGVIAYASAERSSEVATRMALGATSAHVFWLLAREGRLLAIIGAAAGLAAAYATGRLAASWLYDVRAADPLILGASLGLVLTVAIVATLIPARRASRINAAHALRAE
jgi:putative ABC transport system permease protein